MNEAKINLLLFPGLIQPGDPGCAVGFITDGEVEFGESPRFLSLLNFVEGLIGGENDRQMSIFESGVIRGDLYRIGGIG